MIGLHVNITVILSLKTLCSLSQVFTELLHFFPETGLKLLKLNFKMIIVYASMYVWADRLIKKDIY